MEKLTNDQTVELKLARLADARQIARMSRDLVEAGLPWSWTPERVATHIRSPDSNVLTAWAGGQLAGFALMQYLADYAHLNLLAVAPACRRMGIGRQLVEWLEETARVGGLVCVNLEVRAGNETARAFYRELGYRETGSITGYYGGREAAVCLTHDLWYRGVANSLSFTPRGGQ